MIAWGGQPFGAAVGATIAAVTTVPAAYVVTGSMMLVAAAPARFSLDADPRAPS